MKPLPIRLQYGATKATHILRFFPIIVGILFLSGCSPFVDSDQTWHDEDMEIVLQSSRTVGQTFVARHSGLNGIEIWLEPIQGGEGTLRLDLKVSPSEDDLVTSATLPITEVRQPGFYRFSFPRLRNSHGQYYYAVLELDSDALINIGAATSSSYLDGSLYADRTPLAGQIAFRLTYDRGSIGLDLLQFGFLAAVWLVAAGLLFVVPGWAALIVLQKQLLAIRGTHWAESLGVATGLGLATYPVLMLWFHLINIRAGFITIYLLLLSAAAILIRHYRPWRIRLIDLRTTFHRWRLTPTALPDSVLVFVLFLAGVSWLLPTRGLEMPLWYDSVQHGVMVQRILESGGLFSSWEPYAPYQTLSQQFGFHANVAAWAWLTGMNTPQAVIVGGQFISLVAVLALYPLGYRLGGAWGGLISVFAAAVMLIFPAYYTNWGRYPQMAGQTLLCVAGWSAWQLWHSEKGWRWGDLLLAAILIVSTVLTYYRMAFHFLALFIGVWLIAERPLKRLLEHKRWLAMILLVLATVILFSPWLVNLTKGSFLNAEGNPQSDRPLAVGIWTQITDIQIGWQAPLALVIFVGILTMLWSRHRAVAFPVVWLWLLTMLPIVRRLPLPGVGIIQDFTIQTSLYMPQAWIWSAFAGFVVERWRLVVRQWILLPVSVVIILVSVWRLPGRLQLIDRDFDLSTRPDLRAASWIQEHLPQNAFFLINGVVYTDGVSALAGDAGAWIPLLTRRGVVIPPQYALLTERPNEPGYSEAVNNLIRQLSSVPAPTSEGHALICGFPRPITHVYLGQRQGLVNKALPKKTQQPLLIPDQLMQDLAFRLIYHEDQVMIFEFDRSVCANNR